MNKAKVKKRIVKFLDDIAFLFQINGFEKCVIFCDDKDNFAASIELREDYQDVKIYIYPRFFYETPQSQRKILLHELCHVITLPSKQAMYNLLDGKLVTQDSIREINERETSRIENILDGLFQNRLRLAKEAYENYLKK